MLSLVLIVLLLWQMNYLLKFEYLCGDSLDHAYFVMLTQEQYQNFQQVVPPILPYYVTDQGGRPVELLCYLADVSSLPPETEQLIEQLVINRLFQKYIISLLEDFSDTTVRRTATRGRRKIC